MAMNRKVRNTSWAAIGLGFVVVLAALGHQAAVSAGPPGTPAPCFAIPTNDGDYQITWTAVKADPAVNWYVVRKKGDTTPTVKVPDGTIYFWTQGTQGASEPLTFLVRAHNPAGVSAWCEAVVEDEPSPSPSPSPTDDGVNEAVGIRVFPHYSGTLYGDHARVLDKLGGLGVDRISALLQPNMAADEIKFYQDAHNRYGIKIWFAVGAPGKVLSDAQWTSVRNLLSGPLAGMVEVASGWNEPNHRVSNFVAPTAAHQAKLWTNVQQVNAATGQDIKVGTPPLWSGNINTQFNDMRALAPHIQGKYNLINWHMYPHGQTGASLQAMIDRQISEYRSAYGNFPMLNSESGYSTSINSSAGNPVTEAEQAALIDDLVLFHTNRNVDISYFEASDDYDPSLSNREAHFGLWRSDWSNKPAYAVFATLTD